MGISSIKDEKGNITTDTTSSEATEDMNKPVTEILIESVIKDLPTKRSPGPDVSLQNSTKHSKQI